MTHFSDVYSLIAAVVIVVLYRMSQFQLHYGLPWSKRDTDFWGSKSHVRKWKDNGSKFEDKPAFLGSTTWLVFITDFYHAAQWIEAKLFYLIIANHLPLLGSNFITDNLLYSFLSVWAVLGGTLAATGIILKR